MIFSPLPPQRNGIADYVAELAPFLARFFRCTYVVADDVAKPDEIQDATILRLWEYLAAEEAYAATPHLYQIGNNPDHVYMLPVVTRRPGILVLHDLTLHYLHDRATLAKGDRDGYRDGLIRELGDVGRVFAEQFERYGWRGELCFGGIRMIRQLVDRSKLVIVHSAFGKSKAAAVANVTPVVRVPHHVPPDLQAITPALKRQARTRLRVRPDDLVFVSMGFIARAKQVSLALQCLARLRPRLPRFRYLIAGEPDPDYDVKGEVERLGLADVVKITGYVSDEKFFDYVAAADIVLNLRYPTSGETSGTLLRALGSGACVVAVDIGAFGEYPGDCIVKLPWSDQIAADLVAAVIRLVADPKLRRAYGARAREFTQAKHAITVSAAGYRKAIEMAAALPDRPWSTDAPWEFGIGPAIATAGPGQLWREILPYGDDPARTAGVYDETGGAAAILAAEFGFNPVRTLFDGSEPESRSLDLALIVAGDDRLPGELPNLLRAANRALTFGGMLVLDLWQGAAPQPADDMAAILLEAGFSLVRHVTGTSAMAAAGSDPPGTHPSSSDLIRGPMVPSGSGGAEETWMPGSIPGMTIETASDTWWQQEPRTEWCCRAVKVSEFTRPRVRLGPLRLPPIHLGAS